MPTNGFRYKAIIQNENKDECNVTVGCDDELFLKYLHKEIEMSIRRYNIRLLRKFPTVNEDCIKCKNVEIIGRTMPDNGTSNYLYACTIGKDVKAPYCEDFTEKD